ncbi:microcin-processing peptidase 2 [Candidatus Koribacter versatilis Ellin345]|uniref:Microcin-processing peptidase 2 n=1 Tax=Koribacter versatilis (strain Ellin345) TaxID=204669 RepID=Q1IH90_KORVE|nr:metalloprotease TldD [Candidatus Koribacter versatilis]ABF43760.1 microcin-processing peptidase 2 [Candidatus Koribacter versatilis Ellin345]
MDKQFFFQKYGLTEQNVEKYLGAALSAGGDYADLYFEYLTTTSISLDESMVKSASQGISAGCGVRVVAGERTGYAYTDDLAPEKILHAAKTAALIASGPAKTPIVNANELRKKADLYPITSGVLGSDVLGKLELVKRSDEAARSYDSRIQEVRVSYADELRKILVIGSDGTFAEDVQPLSRMSVFCIAKNDLGSARGSAGGGGRVGSEYFEGEASPEHFAKEAARQAIIQLDAREAPAGEMEVVLGPGWPGILLHEAIGHGLEADFNRKKTSAFAGLMGQRVASEKCTVVDNGTMPSRRGSLNVDDEGNPTNNTVLIENGILKGYLTDKLSARLMGMANTGNGRRESYEHIPMPRMTNTYMLAGQDDPEDIIKSVKYGVYAVNFGGGQVDITNGKFVFAASEAYLIENGQVTAPLKGATLIGNGPDVLTRVSMVGNDLKLDEGVGTCGKDGQSVPVGVGIPTLKVDRLTVGGTGR